MEIYHTETQADYDALLIRLKELGYKYINGSEFSEERPYVIVWWTDMVMRSYQDLMEDEEFKSLPIIKYKAKADEKMKFTKENVFGLFGEYRRNRNGISSLDDLERQIMNLEIVDVDDTPEKVVVPKYIADYLIKAQDEITLMRVFEIANAENELKRWKKEYDWIRKNSEKFAKAWIDGCTIEKEPQYIVSIMDLGIDRIILMKNKLGYSFELESENDGYWEVHFTEQQIKEYDKRYWAFAVPVEEEK